MTSERNPHNNCPEKTHEKNFFVRNKKIIAIATVYFNVEKRFTFFPFLSTIQQIPNT